MSPEEALKSSHAVHINMMRGEIAKLTPAQVAHLYEDAECAEIVAEIQRQHPNLPQHPGASTELREAKKLAIDLFQRCPDPLEDDAQKLIGLIANAESALAQPKQGERQDVKVNLERACPNCGQPQVGVYMHDVRTAPVYWHKDGSPDNCQPQQESADEHGKYEKLVKLAHDMTNALGPYPGINRTQLVANAYDALAALRMHKEGR